MKEYIVQNDFEVNLEELIGLISKNKVDFNLEKSFLSKKYTYEENNIKHTISQKNGAIELETKFYNSIYLSILYILILASAILGLLEIEIDFNTKRIILLSLSGLLLFIFLLQTHLNKKAKNKLQKKHEEIAQLIKDTVFANK